MAVLLSTAWVNQTANPAYQLQIVNTGTVGSGVASPPAGWGGVASQVSLSSYASTMLFNDHTCTITVKTPAADDIAILELRANNSNQVALLAYNNSTWVIATNTGAYSTLATSLVARATSFAAVSYADGDTITLTAKGNSYIAYHNGVEVFRWVDTTGVYTPTTDAAHNQVAIGYLWGAGTTGGIDIWTADDLYIYPALTGTSGNGALTATYTQVYPPETAALAGSGTLAATAYHSVASSAALSGGGTLSATAVRNFTPFNETNTAQTNQLVPAGTFGCWVTLIGGGGGGGCGGINQADGGGGGGGGAQIARSFIAAGSLGATYSVGVGAFGSGGPSSPNPANGSPGTASTFSSGAVSLTAGAGGAGVAGNTGTGGAGGTCSASGATVTQNTGGTGATSTNAAPSASAAANANGAGAGGGSGGRGNAFTTGGGGNGGASATVGGGAGGSSGDGASPGSAAAGNGGAGAGGGFGNGNGGTVGRGGVGGNYGGGGGGSGGSNNSSASIGNLPGGNGGSGYTLIEWT